jgi:hypothetical protein
MSFLDWKIMVNGGNDFMLIWQITAWSLGIIVLALAGTYWSTVREWLGVLMVIGLLVVIAPVCWIADKYYAIVHYGRKR